MAGEANVAGVGASIWQGVRVIDSSVWSVPIIAIQIARQMPAEQPRFSTGFLPRNPRNLSARCGEIRRLRTVFPNTGKDQAARTTAAMEHAPRAGVSRCEYNRALDRRHTGQDASGADPPGRTPTGKAKVWRRKRSRRCSPNTCRVCPICDGPIQTLHFSRICVYSRSDVMIGLAKRNYNAYRENHHASADEYDPGILCSFKAGADHDRHFRRSDGQNEHGKYRQNIRRPSTSGPFHT